MAICGACGRESAEDFRFCPACGAARETAPAAEVASERKVVSVLFCDVVGFTASSESADPEDVEARMRPYYARVREELEAFGGTVEKFIGDAVMAVFGAPVSHEDDAERAVRGGLRVLQAIEELNERDASLQLSVRIGVNTGEVVVRPGADSAEGQALVLGDVVNTAARIQTVARVGAVVVGDATYRATERVFVYEELPAEEMKGKTEPVTLHRAVEARGRFGSDLIRASDTPFVGRQVERTLLEGLFDRCARDAQTQLVTLVGEPGAGKSRLAAELFGYIDSRPELITWRQGRCLPYGEGIAFWALGEIVKAHAGVFDTDAPEAAAEKLELVLPDTEERSWLRARLLPLLGIDPGAPTTREESFSAWRQFVESLAADGPAVLVVEDLHWADDALLDFLAHLAEWTEGVPLLLVCTARPELYEKHPGFGSGSRNATTITLSPLSTAETSQLVATLLERTVPSAELQQRIAERAGGNPLYAEEFVRLLAERPDAGEEAFPDSVQALIAARLDTLPPDRKNLLQDAAVLGKVFWAGALTAMAGRDPAEVQLVLHELSRKELVRPARISSMEGDTEYAFWHVLVRDVAYQQIPRTERAAKHLAAAAWIEERAAGRLEDLAEVLVHHYEQAADLLKAAGHDAEADELLEPLRRYLTLAAERARTLDVGRAADLYTRALDIASADDPGRAQLLLDAAEVYHQLVRYADADTALSEAGALYRAAGDPRGTGRVLIAQALLLGSDGAVRGLEPLREAIDLLEDSPGPELMTAYARMASTKYVMGQDREVSEWAERSLELARTLGLPEDVHALGASGGARATFGDAGGLDDMRRAVALAREREMSREAALWLNNLSTNLYPFEGAASALVVSREAIALAESRGIVEVAMNNRATSIEFLYDIGAWDDLLVEADTLLAHDAVWPRLFARLAGADVLSSRGETDLATRQLGGVVDAAREFGEVQVMVSAASVTAAAAIRAGDAGAARLLMEELRDVPDVRGSYNFPAYLPEIIRTAIGAGEVELAESFLDGFEAVAPMHAHARSAAEASIAAARGDHEQAAAGYREAADAWAEFGFVPEHAFALLGLGRSLQTLGRGDEAATALREAREIFATLRAAPALAEIDSLVSASAAREAL